MAPRIRRKQDLRNKPPFDLREILLYGIPFWVGAILLGWYFGGLLGLKSAVVGLILLGIYVGSSTIVTKKFDQARKKSANKAMVIVLAGFLIKIIGLWLITFLLTLVVELNLPILVLTIAFGFSITLIIAILDWSRY